ncbi:MAG: hypothetical protein ACXVJ1_15205 [Candidatus Angelobacter sp.]
MAVIQPIEAASLVWLTAAVVVKPEGHVREPSSAARRMRRLLQQRA